MPTDFSVLHVHQPDHLQRPGHRLGLALDLGDDLVRQRIGRQRARRIAGMDPGLLDVLHDAGDEHVLVLVGQRIDIDLDGVTQVAVDQHRVGARDQIGIVLG